MAALKEVRQRIKAVKGIGQVTKAMKLVASVKLRRVQDKVVQNREYTDTLYQIAGRLASAQSGNGEPLHPLLVEGPPGAEALIIIGSDRGLCGSFNTSLFRYVMNEIRGTEVNLITVGRKTKDYWSRQKFNLVKSYEKLSFPMNWAETEDIARDTVTLHTFMQFHRVRIAYQKFISAGSAKPVITPWLPFTRPEGDAAGASAELKCEPSVQAVLELILPRALTAQLHRAVLESQASEQGARMVAMDAATTNAGELAGNLQLFANRLRQSGITKELLEITSGVEAMNS